MRVLLSTGSPARYMLPPQLGTEQVVCGPDWPDEIAADGRVRSLATPVGSYDLATIARKLPAEQQPDVVACLVDASWRNLPGNLGAFGCPKVLLVADTHHLNSPLLGMLRYMGSEPFDRVVFLYDRHHLSFFQALGLTNAFWFPGLTFPHSDAAVRTARREKREPRIAFVGQAGKFHPRRAPLLAALAARGLPVAQRALPQREALGFYGSSSLGFNASLNGDLNLRVFETIAAGAALLTDRLAPAAGLDEVLTEGVSMATYADQPGLVERATHYLAHPAAARALGNAGAKWFDENLNERRRQAAFAALALDGVPAFPLATPTGTTRVFFGGDTDQLLKTLTVYEGVQELHRTRETVRVAVDATVPEDVADIFQTLPRLQIVRGCASAEEGSDIAILGREQMAGAGSGGANCLWCWDAREEDFAAQVQALGSVGLAPVGGDVALFRRADVAATAENSADRVAEARAHFQQGKVKTAFTLACAELERSPRSAAVRVLLGEISLLRPDGGPLAEKLFRQALQLKPDDASVAVLLAEAVSRQERAPTLAEA